MKSFVMHVLLPLLVLVGGGALAYWLFQSRPVTKPAPPAVVHPLVRIVAAVAQDVQLDVESQGTVQPRTQSTLAAEVAGRVERIAPTLRAGSFFAAGEELLTIEKSEHVRALRATEAEVARAQRQLYPEAERGSLGDLEAMRIRTPDGAEVPFESVAEATFTQGPSAIKRTDRRRTVDVTADVDDTRASNNQIVAALRADYLPQLAAAHPGLRWQFVGEQRQQAETLQGLASGFLVVLFLIYALMAVPLKSYLQPLVVMTAIPFGFCGAIYGHLIMGLDLTIMSMFGLVALAGVAVNDSLVLVEFINQARAAGKSTLDAVRSASLVRFRAILLTSGTTFVGLLPLTLNKSVQAQFLIPMGVSLSFGSMFATTVSLLLVPCLYLVLEDVRALFGRREVQAPTVEAA